MVGVETFLYYLSKLYDFVVYYKEGDPEQVKRLSKNVEVHKYTKPIECDRFFCNYGYDIEVKAKEYYHIIHYDPLNVGFTPMINPEFKYIGVSKVACKGWKEKTGLDIELIYNPLPVEKVEVEKYQDNKIHLISATRLTSEKGLGRMQQLARLLEENKIDYEWVVYTNRQRKPIGRNAIYKEQKLDITPEIAKADFLVQLSDCESYGYTVAESLVQNTPVIITPLEAFKEIGCIHGVNAIICDFSMKQVDLSMIKEKSLKFDYKPIKDGWGKYLPTERTYNPNELIEVECLKTITFIEEGKKCRIHEITKITRARASYLEAKGYVKCI